MNVDRVADCGAKPAAIQLVLDTNVVIDWLVFDDPFMAPLRTQAGSEVAVWTHTLAIAELVRVLAYPQLKLTEDRRRATVDRYCRQTRNVIVPEGFAEGAWMLPPKFPSCRDRDDNLFLALAYHAKAVLVTRDRLLLKMRKKVRKYDVAILDVPQMIGLLTQAPAATNR